MSDQLLMLLMSLVISGRLTLDLYYFIKRKRSKNNVYLRVGEEKVLILCENGDVILHGKKVHNDKEIVDGLSKIITLAKKEWD